MRIWLVAGLACCSCFTPVSDTPIHATPVHVTECSGNCPQGECWDQCTVDAGETDAGVCASGLVSDCSDYGTGFPTTPPFPFCEDSESQYCISFSGDGGVWAVNCTINVTTATLCNGTANVCNAPVGDAGLGPEDGGVGACAICTARFCSN